MKKDDEYYDVALSFAGEDRDYVERVAVFLIQQKVKVFYDRFEEVNLWGKNLYSHLSSVYKDKASYTVIFISKFYAQKLWTNHERESAQSRAFTENEEYILPARFDKTEIPGILNTVGYINLAKHTPENFASLICQKINKGLPIAPPIPIPENNDGQQKPSSATPVADNSKTTSLQQIQLLKSFAFSSDGLNMTSSMSSTWAIDHLKEISSKYNIDAYVLQMKNLILFAFSDSGLNMTHSAAADWALKNFDTIYSNYNIESYILEMKKLISFAFSSNGLNMTSSAAATWALNSFDRIRLGGNLDDYISKMKKLISFAYSSTGLDMSSSAAVKWALDNYDEHKNSI